jgi:Flp pilus assembly protein TadD
MRGHGARAGLRRDGQCSGDGQRAGEWAQARRDELRRNFEAALLATGRLHAAAGRYQPAVTAFRRTVAHEPLNETAHPPGAETNALYRRLLGER